MYLIQEHPTIRMQRDKSKFGMFWIMAPKNGKPFASMEMEVDGKVLKGGADGIKCDEDGNIWSSAGWAGHGYDGVHIFEPREGKRIGQILLPEICSNLCFGGEKEIAFS